MTEPNRGVPAADDVLAMHNDAHDQCFLARSVKTDVRCEPVGLNAG